MQVCEEQVKTEDEVGEIVKRKDKITITLDKSDAFTVLLKDFYKGMLLMESCCLMVFFFLAIALPVGATQVVCLRQKPNEDKYGINVTKNLLVSVTNNTIVSHFN